ncbi:hypothetical protein QEN19_002797 [Hanseniaspora menglaensis]
MLFNHLFVNKKQAIKKFLFVKYVSKNFKSTNESFETIVPKLNISKLTFAHRERLIENWTSTQYKYLNNIQDKKNVTLPLKIYELLPFFISSDNIELKITKYLNNNINILNINNSLVFLKGKLSTDELLTNDIIDNNVIDDFPLDLKKLSYVTNKKMRSYLWKFFFKKQLLIYSSLTSLAVFMPHLAVPYIAIALSICFMKDYLTIYNHIYNEIWYNFLIKQNLIEPLLKYVNKQDVILKEKYLGKELMQESPKIEEKMLLIKEL